MNNIKEFIQLAENIVNEPGDKIIADKIGLYEAEKNILDFNWRIYNEHPNKNYNRGMLSSVQPH